MSSRLGTVRRTVRGTTRRTFRRTLGARVVALLATAVVVAGLGLAAGCSDHASSSSGTSNAGGVAAAPGAKGGAGGGASAGSGGSGSAVDVADTRDLIIMAGLQLSVKDPDQAAAGAEQAVLTVGGYVAGEAEGVGSQTLPSATTTADDSVDTSTGVSQMTLPSPDAAPNTQQALLLLRVPPAHLSAVLATLASAGGVAYRTQSETDVTGQVADVASRVASARASITELRGMIDKAASMNDLISLEQALSSRESDLESLEAQQRALSDEVGFATVTVGYFVPAGAVVKTASSGHRNPFAAGLGDSWHALVATFHGLLAAAGWLLPFGVLVALLWWPVRRLRRTTWWRRRPEHRTQ
jgi:hypothetical protein